MYTATISNTNQTISGKTLMSIYKQLNGMLRVDGPRGLTAITQNGAEIHTSLYEGQGYIKAADGRVIFR